MWPTIKPTSSTRCGLACQPWRTKCLATTPRSAATWQIILTSTSPSPCGMAQRRRSKASDELIRGAGVELLAPRFLLRFLGLRFLTAPIFVLQECSLAQFGERFLKLFLRIHHDGPVPGHRLFQRLSRDQQETDSVVAGLSGDFVAGIEKNQRPIVGLNRGRSIRPFDGLSGYGERS